MAFRYRLIILLPRSKLVSSRYFMLNRQIFLLLLAYRIYFYLLIKGYELQLLPQKAEGNQDNLLSVELKQLETYEYKTGISGDEEGF